MRKLYAEVALALHRVWDVPTRVAHGALALTCVGAWLTGDEVRRGDLHTFLGYTAVGLVGFRLVWGFVGGRWSRWSAFPWFRSAADQPGHTPLAAWSAVVALGLVGLLGITGVVVLGGEQGEGALAGLVGVGAGLTAHTIHGALAWAAAAWLGIHLAGVVKQSVAERQNLALGMVHGRKRSTFDDVPARPAIGAALVGAIALGWSAWVHGEEPASAAIASPSPTWERECSDCHLAYPPKLLPARSWTKVLEGQGDHFGEDLALDPATLAELGAFAAANAAEGGVDQHAWRIAHETPMDQAPLRITELPWWTSTHMDLDSYPFTTPPVRSAANCKACHADAEAGAFRGRSIDVPTPEARSQP